MFDTNVFNRITKSLVRIAYLPEDAQYFVTSLQHAEILQTKDPQLKQRLLTDFCEVVWQTDTELSNIKSTPWGVPWGSPWNNGTGIYNEIKTRLDQHPRAKNSRGNKYDALIIEVCAKENITLVSEDGPVHDVAPIFGVHSITFDEFLKNAETQ